MRVFVTTIPLQLMLGWSVNEAIFCCRAIAGCTWFGGIRRWSDGPSVRAAVGWWIVRLFYLPTLIDGGLSDALGQAKAAANSLG